MNDPNLITAIEEIAYKISFGTMCQAIQMLALVMALLYIGIHKK